MDAYPLMINCDGFYVGGASWFRHRQKFPGSSMTGFLMSHFRHMLRKGVLNRFFYLEFDPAILEGERLAVSVLGGIAGSPRCLV